MNSSIYVENQVKSPKVTVTMPVSLKGYAVRLSLKSFGRNLLTINQTGVLTLTQRTILIPPINKKAMGIAHGLSSIQFC